MYAGRLENICVIICTVISKTVSCIVISFSDLVAVNISFQMLSKKFIWYIVFVLLLFKYHKYAVVKIFGIKISNIHYPVQYSLQILHSLRSLWHWWSSNFIEIEISKVLASNRVDRGNLDLGCNFGPICLLFWIYHATVVCICWYTLGSSSKEFSNPDHPMYLWFLGSLVYEIKFCGQLCQTLW